MAEQEEVTIATRCGIPGCWERKEPNGDLCPDHHGAGYQRDYDIYRAYIAEGYPTFKAAVMAGLRDPDEALD